MSTNRFPINFPQKASHVKPRFFGIPFPISFPSNSSETSINYHVIPNNFSTQFPTENFPKNFRRGFPYHFPYHFPSIPQKDPESTIISKGNFPQKNFPSISHQFPRVIPINSHHVTENFPSGWCPPVKSWFINPINYSYICHKP